jgi:hypothetical protein
VERTLWIGLTDQSDEGSFLWVSGDPSTYRNWSPIEPNSGGGYFPDEDHVLIWHASSGFPLGSWNDAPGDQLHHAVVEVIPPPDNTGSAMRIFEASETTGGGFGLRFTGEPGRTYFLEASCDWVTWETLGVAAHLGNGRFEFVDVNAWRYPGRFYRTASP